MTLVGQTAAAQRPRRVTFVRVIRIVVAIACAFLCAGIYVSAFPGRDAPAFLFCLFLGQFVAIVIHELGHAIVAVAVRWRVVVFAAWPFALHVTNRNIALLPPSKGGGYVLAIPRSNAVASAKRYIAIVAGGPAASLALGCISILIAALTQVDGALSFVGHLELGLGVQSLGFFILTLIPFARSGHESDGAKLWSLRNAGETWGAQRVPLWLVALGRYRIRLAEYPHWLMDGAAALDPAPEGLAQMLASIRVGIVLDSLPVDAGRARAMIDAFRADYGENEWLACCDAYLSAIWEGDGERARARLWAGEPSGELNPLLRAAEAAVAARNGDAALARKKLKEMEIAVRIATPFRDLTFRDIRREIQKVIARTSARAPAPIPASPLPNTPRGASNSGAGH